MRKKTGSLCVLFLFAAIVALKQPPAAASPESDRARLQSAARAALRDPSLLRAKPVFRVAGKTYEYRFPRSNALSKMGKDEGAEPVATLLAMQINLELVRKRANALDGNGRPHIRRRNFWRGPLKWAEFRLARTLADVTRPNSGLTLEKRKNLATAAAKAAEDHLLGRVKRLARRLGLEPVELPRVPLYEAMKLIVMIVPETSPPGGEIRVMGELRYQKLMLDQNHAVLKDEKPWPKANSTPKAEVSLHSGNYRIRIDWPGSPGRAPYLTTCLMGTGTEKCSWGPGGD